MPFLPHRAATGRTASSAGRLLAGILLAAPLLGACGTQPKSAELNIVASTNVWGSVAQAVAGPGVPVASIITEPSSDPHSFEASPRDAASLTDASLIVYNGGGYDPFVDDVLRATPNRLATNAFALTAHPDEDQRGEPNEHVFFDIETVRAVARDVAAKLGQLDSAHAQDYSRRAAEFGTQLDGISQTIASIAAGARGAAVAQTEPLAQYLLDAAGLRDATPREFTSAVENESDPSPAIIAETRGLVENREVRALIFNAQTPDRVTEDLKSHAEAAGVPVVSISETLPPNTTYEQWQAGIVQSLRDALMGGGAQ